MSERNCIAFIGVCGLIGLSLAYFFAKDTIWKVDSAFNQLFGDENKTRTPQWERNLTIAGLFTLVLALVVVLFWINS